MCGIALHLDYTLSIGATPLRGMVDAIRHRGPDGEGFISQQLPYGMLHLGHRLLQIIDPSDQNRQPFQSADGRYVLSFNGELYNYRQLRQELESKGMSLRTNGDTEVLLGWLITYGTTQLHALNGMFAFAFADLQTGEIVIARDRFGVKPLYYHQSEREFLACSEIKGLLASGRIAAQPNPSQIHHYLRFRHVLKPETMFQGIYELPEGHYLRIPGPGTPAIPASYLTKNSLSDNSGSSLSDLLLASVERQMVSDVPVGIFLSGGVDSTLMLALLQELGYKGIPAFSIRTTDRPGSFGSEDYQYAEKAASQYGADLHPVSVEGSLVPRLLESVATLDQPVADTAFLMTSMLSANAKQSAGVVLSGAGADEWFGGYQRHLAYRQALRISQLPSAFLGPLKKITSWLPDGSDHLFRKRFRLIKKFFSGVHHDSQLMAQAFRSLQFGNPFPSDDWEEGSSQLDNLLRLDRHHYLISDVLAITDQASMLHGLEVRTPYLDNDLAEFCLSQGGDKLLSRGRKWMLVEQLVKRGGQQYTTRPKEGLGLPVGHWLRQAENQAFLRDMISPSHPIFEWVDVNQVNATFERHLQGKQDLSSEIMAISILFAWWNQMFGS